MKEEFCLEYMTWEEVDKALHKTKTIILPFGSTEEHGYHLPLSTDYLVAYEIAKRVAEKNNVLVAPLMLALAPDLVRTEKRTSEIPAFPDHMVISDPRKFMSSGIIGNATKANLQKGNKILEILIQGIVEVIEKIDKE